MERTWRLILDGDLSAAENMAVDEAILEECIRGVVPPTVRLYGWKRPSVSLGCFQSLRSGRLDLDYCKSQGIELVRRATGGKAVLHGHDLTFSIAVDAVSIPADFTGVTPSHLWLMNGIVAGLNTLGIPAVIGPQSGVHPARQAVADCFAHIAECDVRVGTSKVAGAAQVRRVGGLLEQGSIPCREPSIDPLLLFPTSKKPEDMVQSMLYRYSASDIKVAIIDGFRHALGVEFVESTLTVDEAATAEKLAFSKYGRDEWTYAHL